LAVYKQSFQPLWAPKLVKSYFDLLTQTQSLRKFLDQARAALNANPEDLNAMARLFYYYQQQGKLDAAQQTVTTFRMHKEASKSEWTGQELYVCARLLEDIHAYPESARYYFALYNSKGMNDAQEQSLAALTNLLLTAPETSIRVGSGNFHVSRHRHHGPGPRLPEMASFPHPETRPPRGEILGRRVSGHPVFPPLAGSGITGASRREIFQLSRTPRTAPKLLEFYAGPAKAKL
jgi:hypothetical protein